MSNFFNRGIIDEFKCCVHKNLVAIASETDEDIARCKVLLKRGSLSGMLIRVCFCETPNGRKHDLLSLGA